MMVPFQDRARVFQAVVAADRAAARHADALSGSLAGHQFVTIRRTSLLEARLAACVRRLCLARGPAAAAGAGFNMTAVGRGLLLPDAERSVQRTPLRRPLAARSRHAKHGTGALPSPPRACDAPPVARRTALRSWGGCRARSCAGACASSSWTSTARRRPAWTAAACSRTSWSAWCIPYALCAYPMWPQCRPAPASREACAARLRRACARRRVAACGAACMRGSTGARRVSIPQGPPTPAGPRRCARASTRAWACSPPRPTSACTRRRPRRPPCRARSRTTSSWAA